MSVKRPVATLCRGSGLEQRKGLEIHFWVLSVATSTENHYLEREPLPSVLQEQHKDGALVNDFSGSCEPSVVGLNHFSEQSAF
jgi:hypothetical protein